MSDQAFIPVNTPLLIGNEKKYLNQCLDSGWISSEGQYVRDFEDKLASTVGRKHGIAVTNGTAAIDAAIEALCIGAGDEVILPSFTIISCVNQIVRAGAKPVLVDADPLTWNMDVSQIGSLLTARTKAIMVVHTYGLPVEMDPVLSLANDYQLKVIEDAAEAHGQTYNGMPCGSFGDISTFSFYANKHITTGEGGMIVTNSDELATACRELRNLCFQPERRFVHDRLGWNLRMTSLQAALGLAQLERLDETLARKRAIGETYRSLLSDLPEIQLPCSRAGGSDNAYWVFGVVLDESLRLDAFEAMKLLAGKGIGTRPFFWPMHEQPVLRKMGLFEGVTLPVSERLARRGFYLPSGAGLTDEEVERSATALREVIRQYC
jgi:perosamine synthetase